MHIVHVNSERNWRGGERQLSYLLSGLAPLGVTQSMVCKGRSELAKYCETNSIPYLSLPLKNAFDIYSALKLRAYLRKTGAQIVHAHSGHAHSVAVISHALGAQAKLIVSRRVDFPISANSLSRYKYSYHGISRFVCVSKAVEINLRRSIEHPDKCLTVHSGIDLEIIAKGNGLTDLRRELGISNDAKVIGMIAALSHEKDHYTFIRTAKALLNSLKAKFIIVGSGQMQRSLELAIRAENLQNDILLLGERNDAIAILRGLDCLLFTSTSEGCPNVIIEAFACGIPVVSTNVGGIPELVLQEKTGLHAPAQDHQALAQCVLRILSDSSLRDQLVNSAKVHAENFSKQKMVEKMYRVYQDVIAEAAARLPLNAANSA